MYVCMRFFLTSMAFSLPRFCSVSVCCTRVSISIDPTMHCIGFVQLAHVNRPSGSEHKQLNCRGGMYVNYFEQEREKGGEIHSNAKWIHRAGGDEFI